MEPLRSKSPCFQASWFPIQTDDLPAPLQSGGQIYAEVIDYERTLYTPSVYSQSQSEIPRATPTPLPPLRDYVEEAQGSFARHAQYGIAFPSPLFGNQASPIDTRGYIDVLRTKSYLASHQSAPRFARHISLLCICLAMELIVIVLLVLSLSKANAQFGIVPYDGIGTNSYTVFRFLPIAVSVVLALCIETAYMPFKQIKAVHPLVRPCKGVNNFWTCVVVSTLVLSAVTLSSILFQPFVDTSVAPIFWLWAIKPQVAAMLVAIHSVIFALTLWMLYRVVSAKRRSSGFQCQEEFRTPTPAADAKFFRFGLRTSFIETLPFIGFYLIFHATTPDFLPSVAVESPDNTSIRPADAVYTMLPLLLALWIPISRLPISASIFPDARIDPQQKLVLFVSTVTAWIIPVLAGGLFSVQFSSIQQQIIVRPHMPAFALLLTLVTCHFAFLLFHHGRLFKRFFQFAHSKETAVLTLRVAKE